MDAASIIEWVNRFGFEYFQYYPSTYKAIVVRNDDPKERGRVQIRCPAVGHTEALNVWVKPSFGGAGTDRGAFWPPEVGDTVYVCFQQGNSGRPQCYFGGYYGAVDSSPDLPSEFAYTDGVPQTRGWVTRGGHRLVFKDTPDSETLELVWHKPGTALDKPAVNRRLTSPSDGAASADREDGETAAIRFLPTGNIEIQDKAEQKITLDAENSKIVIEDANGNVVTLDEDGVKVVPAKEISLGGSADTEAMRFKEWEQWAKTHQHPTAWGPSDKPLQPPPANIKSKVVKLE